MSAVLEANGKRSLKVESGKSSWRRCCLKLCKATKEGGKEHAKLQEQHGTSMDKNTRNKGGGRSEARDLSTDQAISPVIFLLRKLYFIWKTMRTNKGI